MFRFNPVLPGLASLLLGLMNLSANEPGPEKSYVEPPLKDKDRTFWAFRPPVAPAVPTIAANPIDAFLLTKLQESGLTAFAPEADAETLLRRLRFDLTGLPPDEETRETFLAAWKKDPDTAWREVIDSTLTSPHYGERWAQHWLDLARFAETDGFEHDKVRQEAWRYRDWVVTALNEDLPYDRFVALQIAGDLLAPGDPEAAVATGFLLAGPDMPDLNLAEERRHNVLNELTGTVGAAFLGLTMECAQCHDHKTDPLSQADFYRLRAVFESFALPKKDTSLPLSFPSDPKGGVPGRLYLRGDFRRPGPELAPGVPVVLSMEEGLGKEFDPRLAFSTWLTRPDHPLTARVLVNRVWQQHFGSGLVSTPSDFGKQGERPTHPGLLDWLATGFVRKGWSMKWLHREILLSQAWRQSSRSTGNDADWSRRLAVDPDNHLISRQNRRRLDGEAIRDAMLAASGRLQLKMGGPGVRPPLPPEVEVTLRKEQWPVTGDIAEHDRRSLYLFARRNLRYPLFEVFDRPDGNQSCSRRHVSTTAPQSLTMLNDPLVNDLAATLAGRFREGVAEDSIRECYRLVLGREANVEEVTIAKEFLASQPMDRYCLALFNLNEFVYLD